MYKPAAELLLHESVSLFDRFGDDLILYRDQYGFTKCDADLRIRWETACAYVPFTWYFEPEGHRVFIVFNETSTFGLLDLEDGRLQYMKRPALFSDAWFSNLYYWQGEEIFMYSAETDVVRYCFETEQGTFSDYAEAPLFGRLIERGYDPEFAFERLIAPATIISYDMTQTRYVIWDAMTEAENVIPFSEYEEYLLVDRHQNLFSITDATRFYLYEEDKLKFKFDGCQSSVLLKTVLLDGAAQRLAIVSTSSNFGTTWLQIFQKT